METEVLERRFAEIGTRVKVEEPLRGSPRIDVRTDRRGEYFDIRFGRVGPDAELAVVDARPEGPSSPHARSNDMMENAFRSGGTTVYVNRRHPTGIGEDRFRCLSDEERRTGNWSRMVRDADVFAKGSIRLPIMRRSCFRGGTASHEHRAARSGHAARRLSRLTPAGALATGRPPRSSGIV